MASLERFLATLRANGVRSLVLAFDDSAPLPTAEQLAAQARAAAVATEPNPVTVQPSEPPTPELEKLAAQRSEAERAEDLYAGTPVRPADVEALMSQCDEELEAWQNEQAAIPTPAGSVLLLDPMAAPT